MTDITNSKLLRAATSTFEQLGFFYADLDLESWQKEAPLDAVARVAFTGPMQGAVEVKLTEALLPELTTNMLGEEEAQDRAVWSDALGEVANVICGNVLPAIAGPEAVFDLATPEVALQAAGLPPFPGKAVTSGILGVEDGRSEVTLFVSGGEVSFP